VRRLTRRWGVAAACLQHHVKQEFRLAPMVLSRGLNCRNACNEIRSDTSNTSATIAPATLLSGIVTVLPTHSG
jgi:hypothetical protein